MDVKMMRLVIVEDGETDFEALSRCFKEQGFSVKTVQRGKEEESELKGFEGLVLKRIGRKSCSFGNKTIKAGGIEVDPVRREVRKDGAPLELTAREFNLLAYLMKGRGRVFSREILLADVWGSEYHGDVRTVDVTVRRLREKVEDDPSKPRRIRTRRSAGYYFEPKI